MMKRLSRQISSTLPSAMTSGSCRTRMAKLLSCRFLRISRSMKSKLFLSRILEHWRTLFHRLWAGMGLSRLARMEPWGCGTTLTAENITAENSNQRARVSNGCPLREEIKEGLYLLGITTELYDTCCCVRTSSFYLRQWKYTSML